MLNGVFDLLKRLYGVTVKETSRKVDVWHPSVKYYEVHDDELKKEIAGFYIDPYSRPSEKAGGSVAFVSVVSALCQRSVRMFAFASII